MEKYVTIIKSQIVGLLRNKKYNTTSLELKNIGDNIIKIYYNNYFLRYININKYTANDIRRPYSPNWNKFISSLLSDIIKIATSDNSLNVVCMIPVWRNQSILQKCVTCLQKQTVKPSIMLLVSCEEDKQFAILYDLDFINAPQQYIAHKIKIGLEYCRSNMDHEFIMVCSPTDLLSNKWIDEGCKLLKTNDVVGKSETLIMDRFNDDVYMRKIDNNRAKIRIGSMNNLIFDSGKMINRSLLDRINLRMMKDTDEDNDINLFNNILQNQLNIGYIKNSVSIRVIMENITDFIKNNSTIGGYDTFEKLKFIPTLELRLISKLDIKNISDINTNIITNDIKKEVVAKDDDIIITQPKIKFAINDHKMFNSIGIHQVYISTKLNNTSTRIKNSYNLIGYNDPNKPALFYGVFDESDIVKIRDHKDKTYVLWDGDDILNKPDKYIINRIKKYTHVIHIAPSKHVYNSLAKFGMRSTKAVINLSLHDAQFRPMNDRIGTNIIVYNGNKGDDESKYSKSIYMTLVRKLPEFKFIFTNRLNVKYDEISLVYNTCFVGLQLTAVDGISQFVGDLGLMSIPVIHNGDYPNTISWNNVKDIMYQIKRLGNNTKPKIENITTNSPIIELFPTKNTIENVKTGLLVIKYEFTIGKLYSIKINGFQSDSNKIHIVLTDNDMTKHSLVDSYLSSDISINLNYIDCHIHRNLKYISINDDSKKSFAFKSLTITEVSSITAKNEAYNSDILSVKKVETFKKDTKKRYTVGCIMDTFSFTCFDYELNLVPVKQDNWKDILKTTKIDFFLFESAWNGTNGSWDKHITSNSEEIQELIKYLNKRKIPKIFYNKEDPFNYNIFNDFAKHFNGDNDLVVTTDENMINNYKKSGCSNVTSFPFCCQPIIHNPVGKEESDDKNIIFPCSYYSHKYPERCSQMNDMIDSYVDKIDIYDRQFIFNKQTMQIFQFFKYRDWYEFPKKYKNRVKGSLNYEQVLSLYRTYKCVMNTNTVTDSKTMFARRAVEAGASGIPIISDHALGIETIFEDTMVYYDEPDKVSKLLEDTEFRRQLGDKLYKKIMHNYTYKHLINHMIDNISSIKNKKYSEEKVMCLIFIEDVTNLSKFEKITNKYDYVIISETIKNDNTIIYDQISDIDKTFDYYVIMNEWCIYKPNYVENMLLPKLYTDANIIGKGSFNYGNILVSPGLEHRFSNRLNMNTLVIKNNDDIIKLFDSDLLDNLESYMKNSYNGSNMYSVDRFDFIDNEKKYHYYNKYPINIEPVINLPINESHIIPIVMCCYNRIDGLSETIKCLNEQTDRNFVLYIWNNKPTEKQKLLNKISDAKPKFNVYCHQSIKNVGGIGRFYMVKELLKTKNYKYVIFIDDDQYLDKQVVDRFRKVAKPKHSYNWYGRKFVKDMPYFVFNNSKDVNAKKCSVNVKYDQEYDYGGTGGMIIDTDIFKIEDFYNSLPKKFMFVEDLWMSYYGNNKLNYKFIRVEQGIKQINDGNDQCISIWDVKNLLLEHCRSLGWNV